METGDDAQETRAINTERRHMSTESWDTVTGFCYFVKNTRGRTFPMLQTFGLTISDAKLRAREMLARRVEYNRSPLVVVSLAQVTLTTDAKIAHFSTPDAWRTAQIGEIQSASSASR